MNKEMNDKVLKDAAKALVVHKEQRTKVDKQLSKIGDYQEKLSQVNTANEETLDDLLMQAESLLQQQAMDTSLSQIDMEEGLNLVCLTDEETKAVEIEQLELLETVAVKNTSWDDYLENIDAFAEKHDITMSEDPFASLMTSVEKAEISERIRLDYTIEQANCDKYDYVIAASCGVAAGLVDSFFVGMPGKSKLGNWTDSQTDKLVEKFAKMVWKSDKKQGKNLRKEPDGIASAIGFLENRFRVNYDARYASDLAMGDKKLKMSPKDHHLKSLGHSPDLIGLFFSILDQFTGKASFVSDGQLIRVKPQERGSGFELEGANFFAKLFCGFCNWIGHIISDIAGSSGTRGHNDGRRGQGVPIPFFEMFQFCDFSSFRDSKSENSINLAELMSHVFQKGYDARFGAAMAIPVALNEIMIRLLWAIKSRYYHQRSWKDSIPFGNRPELRRMLIVGHGSLCVVDGIDAAIRSSGQLVNFALQLNGIAWSRFAFSALQEIRAVYIANSLDLVSMEKDLENEWQQLYGKG
ncbi:hypothetical protein [Aquibacillus rhizosphaerae]|uniref:Uncharacterized protein n=1 Tax=Aquibacillus rhizosphaerae TaxID=3051431 RepID=A0ABT7L3Q9_9BACI|nr:hypothetical protein [Aquibacillus sp. LR5S19]MDL4839810.1 hypothetical protein [Aquibacillus sp. LR5S19]